MRNNSRGQVLFLHQLSNGVRSAMRQHMKRESLFLELTRVRGGAQTIEG